jgi:hypothetical protein
VYHPAESNFTHHRAVQYGATIRARCKYAAEAAQVAAMIKENALKQRILEKPRDHGSSVGMIRQSDEVTATNVECVE